MNNMKVWTSSLVLVNLLALSGVSSALIHIRHDDSHLIFLSNRFFSISTPALKKHGWDSVSVNDRVWRLTSPNCDQIFLDEYESSELPAIKRIVEAERNWMFRTQKSTVYSKTTFNKFGNDDYKQTLVGLESQERHSDGYRFLIQGPDVSIHRDHMPFELEHVFLFDNHVAFVNDHSISHMYREWCLHEDLARYVAVLRHELERPPLDP